MSESKSLVLRAYDPARDADAGWRIWREIGWMEGDGADQRRLYDLFTKGTAGQVAELSGTAECVALTCPASVRYLEAELEMAAVVSVTTSRLARKRGLARQVTARAVAEQAAAGAHMAGLGMFEQGFYNLLGFGTGPYEHWFSFDPANLRVPGFAGTPRLPIRLGPADARRMHTARCGRLACHGRANLRPATMLEAEVTDLKTGFGLGYLDADGSLAHHFYATAKGENGPYQIRWMSYRTHRELFELLSLIRSLEDQVRLVRFQEPPGVQFQDLLRQPFRARTATRKSEFQNHMEGLAYWQLRICDLPGCMAVCQVGSGPLRFNLELTDPITAIVAEAYGDAQPPWTGSGGSYVVTLDTTSGAENGQDSALPTLSASVGAFSRLWFGVANATSLSLTDQLQGPAELLADLDRVLQLPVPRFDWDF